jgi:GTP-binding protein HflX
MKRAILIDVIPKDSSFNQGEKDLKELSQLVHTYGGIVIVKAIQKRGRPSAKTYLGTGKALEILEESKDKEADMIIVNGSLKPNQIQHLHAIFNIEVWDRIDLILKIFEKHAKTEDAKLQIELASLKHEFPKLYGQGTKLSRLGGGIATRGPGEKLLEVKKRHLRSRIKEIETRLAKIRKTHENQRAVRRRKGLKTIALVGYTNSGKSTLLKTLTNKQNVYIADELFATLDSKIGDLWLPNIQEKVLLADTIGFIQNLPPFLINSFLATLDEVCEADLLLHVIDASDPDVIDKIAVVEDILDDIECMKKPHIYVFNKMDKSRSREISVSRRKKQVHVSARTGEGLDKLLRLIEKALP